MAVLLAFLLGVQDPAAAPADAAVAQFKADYKSPDVKARVEAVAALGKVQHPKTGKILAALLLTDDPAVRRRAAEMLGAWSTKQAEIGALLQAALKPNSRQPLVLAALFDALGTLRHKPAVLEVNNNLNHLHNDVSVAAIRAAGKLGAAKSMDRLIGMWVSVDEYRNPRPSTDGKLGSSNRTPEKDQRYGMQDPELKAAINAIARKTFGTAYEARDWWNANRAAFREQ